MISEGTRLVGELTLESNLHLDGHLKGTIVSEADVSIGHTGRLEGDVKAERVLVSGYVEGCIDCGSLEIVAQGRVYGELHSDDFVIEPGGQFLGQSYPRRQETIAALSDDRAAARLMEGDSRSEPSTPFAAAPGAGREAPAGTTSSDLRGAAAGDDGNQQQTSPPGGAGISGRTSGAEAAAAAEPAEEEAPSTEEGTTRESREGTDRREPRQPVWGRR